jgi:beta-glucosidase
LNSRAFSYYHTGEKDWVVEPGQYEILVGASSRDIRLKTSLEVSGPQPSAIEGPEAYKKFPKGSPVSRSDFAALVGAPIPENREPVKGEYTLNTPVGDMRESFIGRLLYNFMQSQMAKMIDGQEGTPTAYLMQAMAEEMPLRSMMMMGDGPFNREMLNDLLDMINGHFFRGLVSFIGAAIRK